MAIANLSPRQADRGMRLVVAQVMLLVLAQVMLLVLAVALRL